MSRKTDKPEPSLNLFVILVLFAFFVLCFHYAGAVSPWVPNPAAKIEAKSRWQTGPTAEDLSRSMNGRADDIEKPE